MSSPEWSRYLHESSGSLEPPEEIDAEVVRRMLARYAASCRSIAGAVEAVERLGGPVPPRGRVVVEPGDDRRRARELRSRAHFEVTVSSEEVARGKPAPDVFLEAARRLGSRRSSCAAVEDSANGIRAAHAAGMRVVALPNRRYPPPADAPRRSPTSRSPRSAVLDGRLSSAAIVLHATQ